MKGLLKDVAIYGSGDFIFKLVAFAVFPVYAHWLSVEQFGVMSLVTTFAALVSMAMSLGMNSAVNRFYWDPDTPEERRPVVVSTGLGVLMAWSVGVTALMLVATYPLGGMLEGRFGVPWWLISVALVTNVVAQVLEFSLDVLRLNFLPWQFTMLSAFKNLMGVLLGLVLIVGFHQGLAGYFLGLLVGGAVAVPVALWAIRRELRLVFDLELARQLVQFGYPFIFGGLAYWVAGSLDRWMLGELSTVHEVGLYSIAYKVAAVMTFVNGAFGQAWSPYAIKVYADDPDYRGTFSRVLSLWSFGNSILGVGLALFGYEALRLTTPAAYWPAANTLAVLGMGLVLLGTTQITALGLSLEKRSGLLAGAAWLAAAVNVLLNLLLIPRLGGLGAAAATLGAYGVLTGLYLYWTQRLHPIPLEARKLAFSLAVVVGAPWAAFFFNAQAWSPAMVAIKLMVALLVLFLGAIVHDVRVSHVHQMLRKGTP